MTYVIDYWEFGNETGDPKRIELTIDHEPTIEDVEQEGPGPEVGVQSFRVIERKPQ